MRDIFVIIQYLFVATLVCAGADRIALNLAYRLNGGELVRYGLAAVFIFFAALILKNRF